MTKSKMVMGLELIFTLFVMLYFIIAPPFEGLSTEAMRYIGVFLMIILLMMFKVTSDYVIVLLGMVLMVALGVAPFEEVFKPFSQTTFWNLVGIFGFSAGIIKTGLLNRIAVKILRLFPSTFNGQILAMLTTGLVLSPLIPSVTAKMTVLASLVLSLQTADRLKKSSNAATSLFIAMYIAGFIFGLAWTTGGSSAAIIVAMIPKEHFDFVRYIMNSWPWLAGLFIGTYLILITFYKPKADELILPEIDKIPKTPLSKNEKFALVILILALFFWIFGPLINVPSYSVGLIATCLFLVQGTMDSKDFKNRISWDMLVLIGGFLSTSILLQSLHIDRWIAGLLSPILQPLVQNPYIFVVALSILVVLARTVIISEVACMTIFYSVFGETARAVGINPFIILFITLVISQTWHMSYNSIGIDTAEAATDHQLVEYPDIQKMSFSYIALCIVIFLISIPIWKLNGLIA